MELGMYNIERGFIEGQHGTKTELQFVMSVINGIIRPTGYTAPIRLIGSRAQHKWISKGAFWEHCDELPIESQQFWYKYLDTLAHKKKLSRCDIPSLIHDLPSDAPSELEIFLQNDPGSDFDLLLTKKMPRLEIQHEDTQFGSGQLIEIHTLDEVSGPAEYSQRF